MTEQPGGRTPAVPQRKRYSANGRDHSDIPDGWSGFASHKAIAMNKPFSLRIFVADGDPDGLRVVERSNWIGKALMFPRALLPRVKERDELKQTGVYLVEWKDAQGRTLKEPQAREASV